MAKRIYVGNLPPDVTESDVRKLFSRYGKVESLNLKSDRSDRKSGVEASVDMTDGADEAVRALNRKEMEGRSLKVTTTRSR